MRVLVFDVMDVLGLLKPRGLLVYFVVLYPEGYHYVQRNSTVAVGTTRTEVVVRMDRTLL